MGDEPPPHRLHTAVPVLACDGVNRVCGADVKVRNAGQIIVRNRAEKRIKRLCRMGKGKAAAHPNSLRKTTGILPVPKRKRAASGAALSDDKYRFYF